MVLPYKPLHRCCLICASLLSTLRTNISMNFQVTTGSCAALCLLPCMICTGNFCNICELLMCVLIGMYLTEKACCDVCVQPCLLLGLLLLVLLSQLVKSVYSFASARYC